MLSSIIGKTLDAFEENGEFAQLNVYVDKKLATLDKNRIYGSLYTQQRQPKSMQIDSAESTCKLTGSLLQ